MKQSEETRNSIAQSASETQSSIEQARIDILRHLEESGDKATLNRLSTANMNVAVEELESAVNFLLHDDGMEAKRLLFSVRNTVTLY